MQVTKPSNSRSKSRILTNILMILAVAIVAGILVSSLGQISVAADDTSSSKESGKFQVGFITVGPTSDWGFNYQHNQGRLFLEGNLRDRVSTVIVEDIPETAAVERVMQRMIKDGVDIIYATSYGYLDMALRTAEKNPDVIFMHCVGNKQSENLATYSGSIWEPAYVGGVVAAMTSKDNKRFGFVGAHPIPPIFWTVNAFALGAQSIDESITVDIVFTNSWNNPAAETEAVKSLADKGVEVVYILVDSPIAGVQAAERAGIYSLAHHADLSNFAPKGWLTGSIWGWNQLYIDVTLAAMNGTWKSGHFSGGFKEGYAAIAPFGPAVDGETQKKARKVIEQIASGELGVFAGPIYDSNGKERVAAGGALTVDQILSQDWVVRGVRGVAKSDK